jgi:hypothetical protein
MGIMSAFTGNAGPINPSQAQQDYGRLFTPGEQVYAAYQLVRDVMLFTNKRFIMVDKQGVTGHKVEYKSIPYRSITHFAVETAGHFDLDGELKIWLSGVELPIGAEFNRQVDIYEVQKILAQFVVG